MTVLDSATIERLLAVLDHTSLGEVDTPAMIERLCRDAAAGATRPAAVCIYPEHIVTARRVLDAAGAAQVAVATVVNFPDGANNPGRALRETRRAIAAGADEIDLVFPWRAYVSGDREAGPLMLQQCKASCGTRPLKVILETGELGDPLLIREVCGTALEAGADFVKTSTGKGRVGATLDAAQVMLECLCERGRGGFKAAGGVRTLTQAAAYLELADRICGAGWATAARFRIGSSALLGEARAALDLTQPAGSRMQS
ncbi:MAG: deoxyribose-phosphate aldolase [Steroidobacteraceae bacterium]